LLKRWHYEEKSFVEFNSPSYNLYKFMSENITVLIPAYNASKTIRKTIDAILNQTYDSSLIKIVICNDGSTDNTLDILNDYQDKYPNKIRVITQENKGLSITRKILLEYVETK
jgi:glycosyltransferase involved in cell wall biosynthesis